jgi:hypothetical protein
VLLLLPGLSASDVLIMASGRSSGWRRLLSWGVLVEGLSGPRGVIWTPEEAAAILARALPQGSPAVAPAGEGQEVADWLNLDWLPGMGSEAVGAVVRALAKRALSLSGAEESTLICSQWFLNWQLGNPELVAPALGSSGALRRWEQALDELAAALSWLLEQLDLSSAAVVMASTATVMPVENWLNPAALGIAAAEICCAGATLCLTEDVPLALDKLPAGCELGRAPLPPFGRRILAPPGVGFAMESEPTPQATPRPGGFVLLLGGGVRGPYFLAPRPPHVVSTLVSRLLERSAT